MRIHAIPTGRLVGNQTFLRGTGWSSLLRRRRAFEFPVHCFVIEHREGLIAVDAGMTTRAHRPVSQRRFVPEPFVRAEEEAGPQLRARGLRPEDVTSVVLTHLDWDHAGGVGHFPNAEVIVHRPELEFAWTRMGRVRFRSSTWPQDFRPAAFDLEPEPYGPFDRSLPVTRDGRVRVVPLPGHSPGQVGVAVENNGGPGVLFAADHILRQDWFLEDLRADRLLGLGIFFRELAEDTSRRLARLLRERPTVLVPAHDADAPGRLQRMDPAAVG